MTPHERDLARAARDTGRFLDKPGVRAGLAVATGGFSELARLGVREGAKALRPEHPHARHPPRRVHAPRGALYGDRRHSGRLAAGHLPGHHPNAAMASRRGLPGAPARQPGTPWVPGAPRPAGRLHPQRRHLGRLAIGHPDRDA